MSATFEAVQYPFSPTLGHILVWDIEQPPDLPEIVDAIHGRVCPCCGGDLDQYMPGANLVADCCGAGGFRISTPQPDVIRVEWWHPSPGPKPWPFARLVEGSDT